MPDKNGYVSLVFKQIKTEIKNISTLLPSYYKTDWRDIFGRSYFSNYISPFTLLLFRGLFSITYIIYFTADMIFAISTNSVWQYYVYLTIWGFLFSCIYTICAFLCSLSSFYYSLQSAKGVSITEMGKISFSKSNSSFLAVPGLVKPLLHLTTIFHYLTATIELLIVILFWLLLVPYTPNIAAFDNLFKHLFNFVIVLFLSIISNIPFPFLGILYNYVVAALYFILILSAYLFQLPVSPPPLKPGIIYPVIDFGEATTMAIIIIIITCAIAIPICHTIIYLIMGWYKNRVPLVNYDKYNISMKPIQVYQKA